MTYTDTERLSWLLMQPRTGYVQRDAIDARMHATRYPHGSDLLPKDLDPYAATRTGPVSRNSMEVAM